MAKPTFHSISAHIKMKPLLPGEAEGKAMKEKALAEGKHELLKRIKARLDEHKGFSPRVRMALHHAIYVRVMPSSLHIITSRPELDSYIKGRKKRQMKWLKKHRRPIPIVTKEGELIFRNATARSMREGPLEGPNAGTKPGWIHPGREPQNFVEKATAETKEFLKEKFKIQFRTLVERKK